MPIPLTPKNDKGAKMGHSQYSKISGKIAIYEDSDDCLYACYNAGGFGGIHV